MTGRPVILDLYSGAGGAAMGYHLAGFDVVGLDEIAQPRYPFRSGIGDATDWTLLASLIEGFNPVAVHASPPCQRKSRLRYYQPETIEARYQDLIEQTRYLLDCTGLPWVIENVPEAELRDPVELCGCMWRGRLKLYRRRHFEAGGGLELTAPPHAAHVKLCTRNGYLPTPERPFMSVHGGKHSRPWQAAACEVMGTPWMLAEPGAAGLRAGIREVCEAIPPLYTEFVGHQLAAHLATRRGIAV